MNGREFVLAGRYRLVAPLGEGGMATVYRGRDLRLNRDVAVKILREELTRDPAFLERFEHEAQMVAALSHPHIVQVYDVGEENGSRFIVMEYVRSRTLKDAIELDGKLPPDRAVAVMRQVLEALSYAHQRGLVHRDIKPHNILIGPDGQARLADFGIARTVADSATQTAAILGSIHYLSPEQCRGEEASVRSDLYACGIVLYETLSGKPPFDGPNPLAIANQHLHSSLPALEDELPELEAVIGRAAARNPEDRYTDADEMAAALKGLPDIAATHPLVALPVVRQQPALAGGVDAESLVLRRSTRKTGVAAVALIAVLGALAYVASLHVGQYSLPDYPSGPYALLPALVAAVLMAWWLQARSWIYTLDGDAAVVQWGTVSHHRLGVPVHQIGVLQLKQSPIDRLLGIGTIELLARDPDGYERRVVMEDLKQPRQTYDELLRMVGKRGGAGGPL